MTRLWRPTYGQWLLNGKSIESGKTYLVAIASYVQEKGGSGLTELKDTSSGIKVINEKKMDARFALRDELQRVYGKTTEEEFILPNDLITKI